MSGAITEFASAKINLSLRVGRAREDGYHPLDSLVTFADWGDTITVRDEIALMMSMSGEASEDLIEEENNLVLRAARALQDHAGIDKGAMIHLHKEIPVAAGLGGGSADAAATLRALNQLWELDLELDELARIGLSIGADVPACVYSRPLRMRGIGEWIELIDNFPAFNAVLINPGVRVSTGKVFEAFDETQPAELKEAKGRGPNVLDWLSREPNSLERPAMRVQPKIKKALQWLDRQDGVDLVRMSGSGASCFAIFEDDADAEKAADAYEGFSVEVGLAGFKDGELDWC
ncbi:MAG: 4-(cytidine 5'-diphospho)-2-C-methyl-D-erythritol kinase [Maricaulis sp.]|uniref:4-(cytidine 5'-diphospho)-2-C-methyl-D-erythritol kinase n=1 Tax=Maricaulis sp. TaxID=1486257 RepID=UPI001B173289|nr:4-(cytidine 5'-diphospho)-2-C-methyl-D-erythritol kinase [Maricaulis sp.]MBO6729864.1 4-(cytidine 5'-diphospho)-2-C-methyl-D-erythritol kinase [Maricaulis sp.]MBO6848567.1 4-(cytidine 5'-diphospho)-2-C-methyl-D-erythritol kinase [Maricaulis sp.]MBO6878754.1 4-(cytidine 5'-diphospho)-2-C-methyl-D-erythritol kinase [Maricaulis sp.]